MAGGFFFDICSGQWGTQVEQLAVNSLNPILTFPLTETPVAGTIEILVDGVDVPSGWVYNPYENAIIFDVSSAPPAESLVEITYGHYGECLE